MYHLVCWNTKTEILDYTVVLELLKSQFTPWDLHAEPSQHTAKQTSL